LGFFTDYAILDTAGPYALVK